MAINEMAQFESVKTKIQETFEILIVKLIARRDSLFEILSNLKQEFEFQEKNRKAAIEELLKTQQHLDQFTQKVNTNIPIHLKATQVYQQALEDLINPRIKTVPLFNCPRHQSLLSLISEFGEVLDCGVPNYSIKSEPTLTAGKKGKGDNELDATGLVIDAANKQIYLADNGNSRIQVVSFEGQFVKSFGMGVLERPYGIAETEEDILVTDTSHHSLFQFSKKDMKQKNQTGTRGDKEGQLNFPHGLSIDTKGNVFVADSWNHRLSVFSRELEFKKCFGTGQLHLPRDVKLTQECVVVLDSSPICVHFFSRNGTLLSSCISQGMGQDCWVYSPQFFCLDVAENIIISDTNHHAIKIFSRNGQHIHTVGKEGMERGELSKPFGISISPLGTIFVVSHNVNFPLQSF